MFKYMFLMAYMAVMPYAFGMEMETSLVSSDGVGFEAINLGENKTQLQAMMLEEFPQAIKQGNLQGIEYWKAVLPRLYDEQLYEKLLPVMRLILKGETKLSDRDKYLTLAECIYVFVHTPYYPEIRQGIDRFNKAFRGISEAPSNSPKRKIGDDDTFYKRVHAAVVSSQPLATLLRLRDECKTNEQQNFLAAVLSTFIKK